MGREIDPANDADAVEFIQYYREFGLSFTGNHAYITKNLELLLAPPNDQGNTKVQKIIDDLWGLCEEFFKVHKSDLMDRVNSKAMYEYVNYRTPMDEADSEEMYDNLSSWTDRLTTIEQDVNSLKKSLPVTVVLQLFMRQTATMLGKARQSLMDYMKQRDSKVKFKREEKTMYNCFETFKTKVNESQYRKETPPSPTDKQPASHRYSLQ